MSIKNLENLNKDFQLSVGELKKIYNQMKIAIDKNKHHLDCVFFNRVDGELATTDGIQLLVYNYKSIQLETATDDDNFLLFSSVINEIVKNNKDDDIIDFIKTEQGEQYNIKINDRSYKNNENEYHFPKYKIVIEDHEEQDENGERQIIQGAISKNVNVFDFSQYKDRIVNFCEKAISLKASSYRLEFYCDDDTKLHLIYKAEEHTMYDTITLQEKQNINFCFNIKMFLNAIKDNKNGVCGFDKIYYFDKANPVLSKKDDVLYLLMPFTDGVADDNKKFVKDKIDNNIDEIVFKIQKQENRIVLQQDFDLQQTGYWAPSANFIKNYEKARKFFKVKDTMEEICVKRKRRKKLKENRDILDENSFYNLRKKRISKLNEIKEKKIISGEDVKQYDYNWFENETEWKQYDILQHIWNDKIKNITEISNEKIQHYTQILLIYKQWQYLSSYKRELLADVENKLLTFQEKDSGKKQEIEGKTTTRARTTKNVV